MGFNFVRVARQNLVGNDSCWNCLNYFIFFDLILFEFNEWAFIPSRVARENLVGNDLRWNLFNCFTFLQFNFA
jgi:hypothetical protein